MKYHPAVGKIDSRGGVVFVFVLVLVLQGTVLSVPGHCEIC